MTETTHGTTVGALYLISTLAFLVAVFKFGFETPAGQFSSLSSVITGAVYLRHAVPVLRGDNDLRGASAEVKHE